MSEHDTASHTATGSHPPDTAGPGAAATAPASEPSWPWRRSVQTRWTDNDIYGHVNNAVYYHYFDSVINDYLIHEGGLDIHAGGVVGFIVRSECDYLKPVAYPAELQVALRVEKLGRSSVTYQTLLSSGVDPAPCARGRMVHVFVDTASGRPVEIPASIRAALQRLTA